MSNNPANARMTTGQVKTIAGRLAMAIPDMTDAVAKVWVNGKPEVLAARISNLAYRPARLDINDKLFWRMPELFWLDSLRDEGLVVIQNHCFQPDEPKPDIAIISNESGYKHHLKEITPIIILACPLKFDLSHGYAGFFMFPQYGPYTNDDFEWFMRRRIHELRRFLRV